MADNLEPTQEVDNSSPETPVTETPAVETPVKEVSTFTWKDKLNTDLKNSPLMQKFEDSPDGLGKAFESHANLEKLLGHDKVPIPKDANDKEGWARFEKAMGIPEKSSGYALPDVELPGNLKDLSFNKDQFADIVHQHKLTPNQAKGLWDTYVKLNKDMYVKAIQTNQDNLNKLVNGLRNEWGDAYDSNVELGQMVINKFSTDKEENDYLTATFTKDPRGVRFLAKLGNQFAENKVGEFHATRFAKSPDEAQAELNKIRSDPNHPYLNPKAPFKEHEMAVELVNRLESIVFKSKAV
uniref:Capsid assembly protein n=1 Tax=viral metagenome TaxID=1070528 RepID=A0A6M3K7J5_9ZZZZ